MENENVFGSAASEQIGGLTVSPQGSASLDEARKWSKFLAIVGFCFIGLAIMAGLFAGTFFSMMGHEDNMPFPGYLLGAIYAVMGVIYFFPLYYLFKFSMHLKSALLNRSSHQLDMAFENLKAHYKYMGILLIIVLALYVVFGAGMLLMSSMMR